MSRRAHPRDTINCDLFLNDAVICPHCRHAHTDSLHEFFEYGEDTEADCESCGEEFGVSRFITYKYDSFRLVPDTHDCGETLTLRRHRGAEIRNELWCAKCDVVTA